MYARSKGIPAWAAVPILAAFLIEYPFYLVPAFAAFARAFERRLPWFLVALFRGALCGLCFEHGPVPLVGICAIGRAGNGVEPLVQDSACRARWRMRAFLALVAAVVLRGYLDPIYTSPISGLHLEILGHLALIRLCAMVMLVERRVPGIGFGFLPELARNGRSECVTSCTFWLSASRWPGPCGWCTGARSCHLWKIAATFLGMLWVVALSEEFFFRGLLQHWMTQWTGSPAVALAGAVDSVRRGAPWFSRLP